MFHDVNEEIREADFGQEEWNDLSKRYDILLKTLSVNEIFTLDMRLKLLTQENNEAYYQYLGRLLRSHDLGLIAIKLTDRMDNLLDMRVDIVDEGLDCYQTVFDILFSCSRKENPGCRSHPVVPRFNGAERLYQLYKNVLVLSLYRSFDPAQEEDCFRLFFSLAKAFLQESQRILVHIFTCHLPDHHTQKQLLLDVMLYSEKGGLERISNQGAHMLDGLFKNRFACKDKKGSLDALYENKHLMAEVATAFSIIFTNFLNNP